MTGRAQVLREQQRLDDTFKRASGVTGDPELLSDFARHLCVLVSGFLEQAVIELLLEHVRQRSPASIERHVEQHLRRFTSPKANNLIALFGTFDLAWEADLKTYLVDEYKDAVDGVVTLRHRIAHGQFTGVTMHSAQSYYTRVKKIVDHIADLCVPT
jgi:hypothetical protein